MLEACTCFICAYHALQGAPICTGLHRVGSRAITLLLSAATRMCAKCMRTSLQVVVHRYPAAAVNHASTGRDGLHRPKGACIPSLLDAVYAILCRPALRGLRQRTTHAYTMSS